MMLKSYLKFLELTEENETSPNRIYKMDCGYNANCNRDTDIYFDCRMYNACIFHIVLQVLK